MRRLAVLSSILLLASGVAFAQNIERTVKAGTRSAVGALFPYWHQTCYQAAIPEPKVSQAPKNGTVVIERHTREMPDKHPCAGRQLTGPIMFYTPAKGFKGVDEFTIEFAFASNDVNVPVMRSSTYRITVQ